MPRLSVLGVVAQKSYTVVELLCYFDVELLIGGHMVKRITMRRAGGSVTVTIPKDMSERYHMEAGEEVFAVETDRGVLLTPYDPAFERAMSVYERGAHRYRNALRELAK
jgi:putative addiction module antidote